MLSIGGTKLTLDAKQQSRESQEDNQKFLIVFTFLQINIDSCVYSVCVYGKYFSSTVQSSLLTLISVFVARRSFRLLLTKI